MDNTVIIKGNKYGIVVVIDENAEFDTVKEEMAEKFKTASKFFDKANMAISFEGRKLSPVEERTLLTIIKENSELNIVCVIDNDEIREKYFKQAVEEKLEEISAHNAELYKGTLRSGQEISAEGSIVILGDINPQAKVIARGNVIVIGAIKGTVVAGCDGNEDCFVLALSMAPIQIRIGDIIARCSDNGLKNKALSDEPMIAFVEDRNIYIEKLSHEILNEISL